MQFVEIKIVNMYLINLGGGDPLEQTRLRSEYLDKKRAEQEERTKMGLPIQDDWNPFPAWLRNLVKEIAAEYSSKARFDDENRVYRLRVKGEREEFEDFYSGWAQRFEAARLADTANIEWSNNNQVHVTATGESEQEALYELDQHHSGYASTQSKGGAQEKAARAQAAQA